MPIICHRINQIDKLKSIPPKYGVEIDVRHDPRNNNLYLNHDPGTGDDLEEYLKSFKHAFVIFNIKEAGIEGRCIEIASKYSISKEKYFLLDVEFPYLYRASREGVKEIAVRYSEDEPIELAAKYAGKVAWVWIDTNTVLPLDKVSVSKLEKFKKALVCPERWGRPNDIAKYITELSALNLKLDAVMTDLKYAEEWEKSGLVKA